MSELEKYQGIYSSPEKFPRYGHTNHGARALSLLRKWNPASLVDVGCGYNEFVLAARAQSPALTATGVDFACPGADLQADITALPFTTKSVDVVTAFDVMEHVTPEQVDAALAEMARISARFIFSISYQASVNKWRGETLHPTVRPEAWWITRLVRAGAVAIERIGRFLTGRWQPALRIPAESRVILVGNGPSVLAAERGTEIDSFDEVIRFNNFALAGFEKFTGAKTTLWSTFFKRIDSLEKHPRVICLHEADKPPASCTEAFHVASVYYNRIRNDVQRRAAWQSGFLRDVEPLLASSGVMVAAWLLEVIGVRQLTLTGFDHFSKKKSGQHHYWLAQSFKAPPEHDGALEAALFAEWAAVGRVRYLA